MQWSFTDFSFSTITIILFSVFLIKILTMPIKSTYYIRKPQVVSCDGARQEALRRSCVDNNGRVIAYFCIPIQVVHTLYENETVRRVCGVYLPDGIDRNAILDVGALTKPALKFFTRTLNLSLERVGRGNPPAVLRKRLSIYTSRFGVNVDTACSRIRDLDRLRFKFNSNQAQPISWAIKSITSDSGRSLAVDGGALLPDGGARGPQRGLHASRPRPEDVVDFIQRMRRRRRRARPGGGVGPGGPGVGPGGPGVGPDGPGGPGGLGVGPGGPGGPMEARIFGNFGENIGRGGLIQAGAPVVPDPGVGPLLQNLLNVDLNFFRNRGIDNLRAEEVANAVNWLNQGFGYDDELDDLDGFDDDNEDA